MASSRIFINFGRRYPSHVVYAVIFRDYARQFLDVHDLEKRTATIKGEIFAHVGKPKIILRSPNQPTLCLKSGLPLTDILSMEMLNEARTAACAGRSLSTPMTEKVKVFQRRSWSRQCTAFRRDPHQKTFTLRAVHLRHGKQGLVPVI